ncbi:hypothetical protein OROHE_018838 [Orobanche hederae]
MDTSENGFKGSFKTKLKQASLLWLEGFREACCLHRAIIYCLRSKELAIRTGQCFLLNGFIFLGSILVLRSFVSPTLQWVLPDGFQLINSQESCPFGEYNDIAKYGFFAVEKHVSSGSESSGRKDTSHSDKATDLEGVMIGIAEQVYSVLLLSFFFLEVFVTGFIPCIGKALNFLLLSWMYAYYCFE